MKPYLFIVACMLPLALSAQGVQWLESNHNFGVFAEDSGAVRTQFRFVNTTQESVSIIAARSSCGCTTPKYPRHAIAVGDTATIDVVYDPTGRPGRFSKYVAIDLNDGSERKKLTISGTVVGSAQTLASRYPIEASEGMLLSRNSVLFGSMKKGQTRTATIELYNRTTDSISPQVAGMPLGMSVDIVPPMVGPGEQASLIFYNNSAKSPMYGIVEDTITVDGFAMPTVAVIEEDFSRLTPREIEKGPAVHVENDIIDFARFSRADATLTRSIAVYNNGRSPLEIRRVYSSDKGIQVTIDKTKIKPGKSATVTVCINPALLEGDLLNGRLQIIANDPAHPTTTIRLSGEII